MSANRSSRPIPRSLAVHRGLASGRQPPLLFGLLAALLALPAGSALAANTLPGSHAKLVQPSSTGDAKAARQALVKQHMQTVATPVQHPGKIVGGNRLPHARTIVTKRILPP